MAVRDFVTVYILGYVCFEGDMLGCAPIGSAGGLRIARVLSKVLFGGEVPIEKREGEWHRVGAGSVQAAMLFGGAQPIGKFSPKSSQLADAIVEFGYTGHRFVLCLRSKKSPNYNSIDPGSNGQQNITELRHDVLGLHEHVRRKLLAAGEVSDHTIIDGFRGGKGATEDRRFKATSVLGSEGMMHIYTYPLTLLPDSTGALEYDFEDGPGEDPSNADLVYTDRNSSFGLFIREFEGPSAAARSGVRRVKRWWNDLPFALFLRRHYIKLTTGGTLIVMDGWSISEELLDDLIDAIFVGGLHNNALCDYRRSINDYEGAAAPEGIEIPAQSGKSVICALTYTQSNNWSYELLSGVFDLMHKFVQAKDSDRLRVLLTIAGFGFAFGTVIFRQALEHQRELAAGALVFATCVVGIFGTLSMLNRRKTSMLRAFRRVLVLVVLSLVIILSGLALISWKGELGGGDNRESSDPVVARSVITSEQCGGCHIQSGITFSGSVTNVFHNETVSHRRSRVTVKPPKPPKDSSTVSTCPKPLLPPTDSNIAK
jgi:hypothetical protein